MTAHHRPAAFTTPAQIARFHDAAEVFAPSRWPDLPHPREVTFTAKWVNDQLERHMAEVVERQQRQAAERRAALIAEGKGYIAVPENARLKGRDYRRRQIVQLVATRPLPSFEIAEAMGCSMTTIQKDLAALMAAGVVAFEFRALDRSRNPVRVYHRTAQEAAE